MELQIRELDVERAHNPHLRRQCVHFRGAQRLAVQSVTRRQQIDCVRGSQLEGDQPLGGSWRTSVGRIGGDNSVSGAAELEEVRMRL